MKYSKEVYVASRSELIDIGMQTLKGLGADHICKVCIAHGGSCCRGCVHLLNGIGCQSTNTSCTSWLCGYLKLLFYEAGKIQEWNAFWDEVPGIDFRMDYTPSNVTLSAHIEIPVMKQLGEALAHDLETKLSGEKDTLDYIILAGELDELIDEISSAEQPDEAKSLIKRLTYLTKNFTEFRRCLAEIHEGRTCEY